MLEERIIQSFKSCIISPNNGADSVTIHLREDRRHINEKDLKTIKSKIKNSS